MKRKFISIFFILFCSITFAEPELVVQEGINGGADYVKYSNDGKYIMSKTRREIKIFLSESGVLVKSFLNTDSIKIDDISPDANFFVSQLGTGGKRKIILTNIETRAKSVFGNISSKRDPASITFSPDGRSLAVTMEKWIDIYDIETFKRTSILKNLDYYFYDKVEWSHDGRYLSIVTGKLKKIEGVGKRVHNDTNIVYHLPSNKIISKYYNNDKLNDNFKFVHFTNSSISSDNQYIVCQSDKTIYIRKLYSDSIIKEFTLPKEKGFIKGIEFSYDNKYLIIQQQYKTTVLQCSDWSEFYSEERTSREYSFACSPNSNEFAIAAFQEIQIKQIGKPDVKRTVSGASQLWHIHYNPQDDSSLVANGILDGATTLFDSDFKKQNLKRTLPTGTSYIAMFNGGFYYRMPKSKKIMRYSLSDGAEIEMQGLKNKSPFALLASPSGKTLAVWDNSRKRIFVYSVNNDVMELKNSFASDIFVSQYSHISSDGRYIQLMVKGKDSYFYDIFIYDVEMVEKKMTVFKRWSVYTAFSPDNVYFANEESGISVYEIKTWKELINMSNCKNPFFSSDGKYLAGYYDNPTNVECALYNVGSWKEVRRIRVLVRPVLSFFSSDNSKIICLEKTGIVRCYSVETGELLSSSLANSSGDWLTYTPEGWFDGSEDGINKFVHVTNGMETTDLDQLSETLYRPDLVAAKLCGENVSGNASLDGVTAGSSKDGTVLEKLVSTGNPPRVIFVHPHADSVSRDVTVNFTVQDQGGGIGAVYLSLNGKVIQIAEGSRKFALVGGDAKVAQSGGGKTVTYAHTLSLQNGENIIEAYAMNSAGKIESRKASTKITWRGATQKPSLYVLSVGVNDYRDRNLRLDYAVPDASAMAESFRVAKGKLYDAVNITTVLNADVTAEGISAAFDAVSQKVSADDVFVLYISGHGMTHTDGDYYFIPVDFRYRNSDSIPQEGISKRFITENLSKIKAQKTLVILDTCNSGSFINASARGMAEKTAIDRLSRATGQATIAASSDQQSAMEGYKGHGVFTYVLLEGLSGKADLNGDGYISVSELASYAEEKVPELSFEKWGYEQFPQVDLRKQSSFPLVGK